MIVGAEVFPSARGEVMDVGLTAGPKVPGDEVCAKVLAGPVGAAVSFRPIHG